MKNLIKESNNLKFAVSGNMPNGDQFRAVIRLNDECKNGHEDFSITGDIWEKGKRKTDRNLIASGAIGDRLAKVNEKFALLNRLHLCDSNGIPMHCVANMFYHLQNGFNRVKIDFKTDFCNYYRITPEQFDALNQCKEKDHFIAVFVSTPEILENWKNEAITAINWIEEKTEAKFKSEATKSNLILPIPEILEQLKQKFISGYFSPEKVAKRVEEAKEAKKQKKIKDLREGLKKEIKSKTLDTQIKIFLIELFGTHDNVIFYSHRKEIAFNYTESTYSTYSKKWNKEEVKIFIEKNPFDIPVKIKYNY